LPDTIRSLRIATKEFSGTIRSLRIATKEFSDTIRSLRIATKEFSGTIRSLRIGTKEFSGTIRSLRIGTKQLPGTIRSLRIATREFSDTIRSLRIATKEFSGSEPDAPPGTRYLPDSPPARASVKRSVTCAEHDTISLQLIFQSFLHHVVLSTKMSLYSMRVNTSVHPTVAKLTKIKAFGIPELVAGTHSWSLSVQFSQLWSLSKWTHSARAKMSFIDQLQTDRVSLVSPVS